MNHNIDPDKHCCCCYVITLIRMTEPIKTYIAIIVPIGTWMDLSTIKICHLKLITLIQGKGLES